MTGSTATFVVIKASTGELLAAANTTPTGAAAADSGLSAQQPAGPVFGVASTLALLRSPIASQQSQETYQLTTRIDCSQPYTIGGQVFRNSQGPSLAGVQLGAAVEGGCATGLARASADVRPATLQAAAYDLGLAAPRDDVDRTPGWLTVADQLGTPAFHGSVPLTDQRADADPVPKAENMVGEGEVLVSPLSMARGMATVASGTRRAVRLIVDPPPSRQDIPKDLNPGEVEALRLLLSKGVTEPGGSAHALSALGDVHALAGTAGYGTGKGQKRQAWCVGYLGDYAFAVLVPNSGTSAAPAVSIVTKFLNAAR
jgi:cell division protein FtsI/penicillin-binding protein 2